MSATRAKPLRIGELAELLGTPPRTIRYYEEIGLLPGAEDRAQGKHRAYTEADVERLGEIIRLRDLLGLRLKELSTLLAAEEARARAGPRAHQYAARSGAPAPARARATRIGAGGQASSRAATPRGERGA